MGTPYAELEKPLEDYALMCRGCLAESGVMKDMVEWGLTEDFYKYTGVKVDSSDCISQLLCTTCEDSLGKCRDFRNQCCNSTKLLFDIAKKKSNQSSTEQTITNQINEVTEQNEQEESDPITTSSVLFDNQLIVMITAADAIAKIQLTCPYKCPDKFLKKPDLLIHLTKYHSVDEKTFTIDLRYYCYFKDCSYNVNSNANKWFSGRKFLNQHVNKVHRKKRLRCDTCNLRFSTNSAYEGHLKTCNMKFPCPACSKDYDANEKLLVHMMRRHPETHKQYKNERKANKRKAKNEIETKKAKIETERLETYMCDSPKRSFATQTLRPEENIKNDVSLPPWNVPGKSDEAKTDEISTQTVFEDLLSLKSQNSEDESIFFSETVSLSDIQTQTFPLEFGLSRSHKETITSETQSPDLSIKETQTCVCLYDSPKMNFRLFDSVSSSPSSINLTSTETQTGELRSNVKSDVLLSFNSTETQTCFDNEEDKNPL